MLQRTTAIQIGAICALLIGGCGGASGPDDADRQIESTAGKADALTGSCLDTQHQQDACGGQGDGECWCDDQCATYGDCCDDAATVCAVDECVMEDDRCGAGLSCVDAGGVLDCQGPCERVTEGDGTAACPANWRMAPNNQGLVFCLREALETSGAAEPVCDRLSDGILGYVDEGIGACPPDAQTDHDGGNTSCTFEGLESPADANAYCDYVADSGVLGYYWEACPAATEASVGRGSGPTPTGNTAARRPWPSSLAPTC